MKLRLRNTNIVISKQVDDYFKNMRESTEIVRKAIYELYNSQDFDASLKDSISSLLDLRLKNDSWIRPNLVRIAYEVSGGKDLEYIIPVMVSAELFNFSTYHSNNIFDKKNSLDYNTEFISSFVIFNLASNIISNPNNHYDVRNTLSILNFLNQKNMEVYLGQSIDLNELRIENTKWTDNSNFDLFLEKYKERCKLIGGSTSEFCFMSGATLSDNTNDINDLSQIGELFGTVMQIVNDLSDFAIYFDTENIKRYSDITSGRLTLPVYLLFQELKSKEGLTIKDFKLLSRDELDAYIKKYFYKNSDIVNYILTIIDSYWNSIKFILESKDKSFRRKFAFLYNSIYLSKYIRFFK